MRRSAILELIIKTARELREKYTSSGVTQIHFILAMIELYYRGNEETKADKEFLEALELLKLDQKEMLCFYEKASDKLNLTRLFGYDEIHAFERCLELVELAAEVDNYRTVTTQELVAKIIKEPSSKTNQSQTDESAKSWFTGPKSDADSAHFFK